MLPSISLDTALIFENTVHFYGLVFEVDGSAGGSYTFVFHDSISEHCELSKCTVITEIKEDPKSVMQGIEIERYFSYAISLKLCL